MRPGGGERAFRRTKPLSSLESKLDDRLVRMGTSLQEVREVLPKLTPLLRRLGVQSRAIPLLKASKRKEAKDFLGEWDKASKADRRHLPLEAFCVLAGVGTPEIWAALQEVLFSEGQKEAEGLAALAQPFVVKATIQSAMVPGAEGREDRKMLLQRTGFVPTPKNLFVSLPNVRSLDASSHETKIQVNVLPPMEGVVKRMSERFGEQKALPPPPEEEEEEG